MVRPEDMPPPSRFTEEFAGVLDGVIRSADITRQAIADEIGRSRAFVTEQLLGQRAIDTDVIAAIAGLIGVSPRFLVRSVLDQLPSELQELSLGATGYPTVQPPQGEARKTLRKAAQDAADEDELARRRRPLIAAGIDPKEPARTRKTKAARKTARPAPLSLQPRDDD